MRSLLALAFALPLSAHAAGYSLAKTVPLGPPDGWDYLGFDAGRHRVFVSHETMVDVVDAHSGTPQGHLNGLHGAHLAVVDPANGEIWADSGDTAQVTAFDGTTFKALRSMPAGEDADSMAFDPGSHRLVVMNGDPGTATIIDTGGAGAKTVSLGGKPEAAVSGDAGIVYANLADTAEIARIDVTRAAVTARWKLPDCVSPHGIAYDAATKLLFSSCLNAKALVVDAGSGMVRGSFPIGRGTDAAAFDPAHHRALIPAGDGTVTVLNVSGSGVVTPGGTVSTAQGARTITVDPASGRFFTATATVTGPRPPGHGGLVPHFQFAPNTVKLLAYDPS